MPKGTHVTDDESILDIPQGHISLYEINVNRLDGAGNSNLIYPYITKQGTLGSFKTVSTESFQAFDYGQEISGSYPLSATISTDYYSKSAQPASVYGNRDRIRALKNTFNYYKPLSRHYAYETPDWNKDDQDIKLVSIPSIFFGSSIKKGSVKMNYYIEGQRVATLEDKKRNGELIQTVGPVTPGVPATGSLQVDASVVALLDNKRIVLEDSAGNFATFIFDSSGNSSTGDLDNSGNVIIQLNGLDGEYALAAEQVTNAINGVTSLLITATQNVDVINLAQDEDGGNTTIQNPDNIFEGLQIASFSGGSPANTVDPNDGKVAGVVLYNEGFVALTGSWDLSTTLKAEFVSGQDNESPKWRHWGEKDRVDPVTEFARSSSWDIEFLGTNYIPTMTMFAHAKQGDLNYSNNPTFIDYEDRNDGDPYKVVVENISDDPEVDHVQGKIDPSSGTSAVKFVEDKDLHIANIAQSPYEGADAAFEKTTYISKIGIYDENKNLIGIAKLATPVKKTESRQYTFKMKVDF